MAKGERSVMSRGGSDNKHVRIQLAIAVSSIYTSL